MLTRNASWLVEDPVLDEPADLLAIPEIRQHIAHEPHDDELGFRSLLEMPEAPPSPWWREEKPRERATGRSRRRRAANLAAIA